MSVEIEIESVEDLPVSVRGLIYNIENNILSVYPTEWETYVDSYYRSEFDTEDGPGKHIVDVINISFTADEAPYPWPNLAVCITSANLAIELLNGVVKSINLEVNED